MQHGMTHLMMAGSSFNFRMSLSSDMAGCRCSHFSHALIGVYATRISLSSDGAGCLGSLSSHELLWMLWLLTMTGPSCHPLLDERR